MPLALILLSGGRFTTDSGLLYNILLAQPPVEVSPCYLHPSTRSVCPLLCLFIQHLNLLVMFPPAPLMSMLQSCIGDLVLVLLQYLLTSCPLFYMVFKLLVYPAQLFSSHLVSVLSSILCLAANWWLFWES